MALNAEGRGGAGNRYYRGEADSELRPQDLTDLVGQIDLDPWRARCVLLPASINSNILPGRARRGGLRVAVDYHRIRDIGELRDRGQRLHAAAGEIELDKIKRQQGMDITIVTSARTNEEALDLLKLMGMPFAEAKQTEARRANARLSVRITCRAKRSCSKGLKSPVAAAAASMLIASSILDRDFQRNTRQTAGLYPLRLFGTR